jgi:carboxyl-terminal processing protease
MKAKSMLALLLGGLWLAGIVHAEDHVTGIGVALAVRDHAVKIMTVLPNTPAAKAGLSAGLIVQKIDGTPTDDTHLKDWVEKLRGDAGTKVKLELVDAANGKTNTVELIREQIKL